MGGRCTGDRCGTIRARGPGEAPVVLDFYSTECPPCEAVAPKYEGVSELYGKRSGS